MKFKPCDLPSNEGFRDILANAAVVALLAVVYGAFVLFAQWSSSNKDKSSKEKLDKLTELLKKQDVEKLKNLLSTLDDSTAEKILALKADFTPEQLIADMQLNSSMINEYNTTFKSIRAKCLTIPPVEIAMQEGKAFNAAYNLYANTYGYKHTLGPQDVGLAVNDWKIFKFGDVPKKYVTLCKTLQNKPVQDGKQKTLKELGFNKSNLHLIYDEMIRFWYDNPDFIYKYDKERDEFTENTKKLLVKAILTKKCDWYEDWVDNSYPDPNNMYAQANIDKAIQSCEGDDGVNAYAYGQELGFFLEDPFSIVLGAGICGNSAGRVGMQMIPMLKKLADAQNNKQ